MIKADELFDLGGCGLGGLFLIADVWVALSRLDGYIRENIRPNVSQMTNSSQLVPRTVVIHDGNIIEKGFTLEVGPIARQGLKVIVDNEQLEGASVVYAGAFLDGSDISIGRGCIVESGAYIKGPSIIGDYTEVRQGAYMRGSCLIGDMCVVGHATEVKNSIFLNGAKAGHFAYVGDSILGNNVNLGAGTKLANLKITGSTVFVRIDGTNVDTGLRKMGAILGDGVETGCNTVTNPGTILGKSVMVYPNTSVKPRYYKKIKLITQNTR